MISEPNHFFQPSMAEPPNLDTEHAVRDNTESVPEVMERGYPLLSLHLQIL